MQLSIEIKDVHCSSLLLFTPVSQLLDKIIKKNNFALYSTQALGCVGYDFEVGRDIVYFMLSNYFPKIFQH